jgi:phage major head subunit gpT-like protein
MKITPAWVHTFETNIQTLVSNVWARRASMLVWDKLMSVRQSTAGSELYFWLLETARIRKEGQGGNKRWEEIGATSFEIVNENSGDGLRLTKNEIEDNQLGPERGAILRGTPVLDYAASWARQVGASAAYWPQEQMFELLRVGETKKGYDGKNFFATDHPVNPFSTAAGDYANLLTGSASGAYPGALPIHGADLDVAAANLAKAFAYVGTIRAPDGKTRNLRVKYLLVGPALQYRAMQLLGTKFLTMAGIENVLTNFGVEAIVANELTDEPNSYYLVVESMPEEGGALIFQDREPYKLTSYQPESEAELQRKKEYEWMFDGRNAVSFGHPYLIYKVKP